MRFRLALAVFILAGLTRSPEDLALKDIALADLDQCWN
ncbi:hypothetical protein BH20PSE1_BH20PSE1_24940 [soil metagenome]